AERRELDRDLPDAGGHAAGGAGIHADDGAQAGSRARELNKHRLERDRRSSCSPARGTSLIFFRYWLLLARRGDLELGIRRRVNATLIATFLVGLFVSCGIAYFAEYQHAHDEVMLRARLLLDSARSVRSYIGESVAPLLVPPKVTGFVMQSTPA